MALTTLPRDVTLRSTDATWTAADWEQLPDDGQRYEIIAGVLYVSTAPSPTHQLIVLDIVATLREHMGVPGWGSSDGAGGPLHARLRPGAAGRAAAADRGSRRHRPAADRGCAGPRGGGAFAVECGIRSGQTSP